jgi:hypothetical protein
METIVCHSVTLWPTTTALVFFFGRIFIKCDREVQYEMLWSKAEGLSFVKICSVAITLYLELWINFYSYPPYSVNDFCEILDRI